MQAGETLLDSLDRMTVGCALGILIGSVATNPGDHAVAGRLAFAVASAVIASATVWAVQR